MTRKLCQGVYCSLLLNAILICSSTKSFSQINIDSSKKVLLTKAENKQSAFITVKAANVIYPDALIGNEEKTLDYIEKFSANRRDYLIRTYTKGKKFFPKVKTILKKHNVPSEVMVLLALESAFNGNAVSGAGAVGYWQFMDATAIEYGLKITPQLSKEEKNILIKSNKKKADSIFKVMAKAKDDRKNFYKSTNAAAKYLKHRSNNLDKDLLLMVASYNCGEGNVKKAINKSGKANANFWDIKSYLPAETQNYVMNFIALNVIFNNYEKFAADKLSFKDITIKADSFEGEMVEEMGEFSSLKEK